MVSAMVVLVLIIFILCFLVSYLYGKPHPKFPPGPVRWPIWGAYLQLLVENYRFPFQAMHWMAQRYNTDLLGMYLGPFPTVVACSQSSVRELLTRPEFQGRVKGFVPQTRDPDGVIRGQFFTEGEGWIEQRRFMLRNLRDFGFGTRKKNYENILEEEIRDFIDMLQSSNVKEVCYEGKAEFPTVLYAVFLNFAMEVLTGSRLPPVLHSRLRQFARRILQFQAAVDSTSGAINMTPWVRHIAPQWSGYNDCVKGNAAIKEFIQEMIEEHKATFTLDAMRDFCDTYLKELSEEKESNSKHWFSEPQLVMTLWEMFFPSAMTATGTVTFAVEQLLRHTYVQERLQREINCVVGSSRLPTLDDRTKMTVPSFDELTVKTKDQVSANPTTLQGLTFSVEEMLEMTRMTVPSFDELTDKIKDQVSANPTTLQGLTFSVEEMLEMTRMPYTEAVLRETMRLDPVVPLALPHRCTQDTYFRGYIIPKDTMMIANLWGCHRDETVWTNPLEFKPERHLDEHGNINKKDMTMPFGLGKRVCSGETFARQNMFLVLTSLLQHFTLALPAGHPLPDAAKHIPGINVAPHPFWVQLIPR